MSHQILAVHTFLGARRRVGSKARGFAASGIILVGLTWIFSALWVGVGTGIHENYETPSTPVRDFDPSPCPTWATDSDHRLTSFARSAPDIQANAWSVNISGSAVAGAICFVIVHPIILLGEGLLFGR